LSSTSTIKELKAPTSPTLSTTTICQVGLAAERSIPGDISGVIELMDLYPVGDADETKNTTTINKCDILERFMINPS
jgi:hypothetical protein